MQTQILKDNGMLKMDLIQKIFEVKSKSDTKGELKDFCDLDSVEMPKLKGGSIPIRLAPNSTTVINFIQQFNNNLTTNDNLTQSEIIKILSEYACYDKAATFKDKQNHSITVEQMINTEINDIIQFIDKYKMDLERSNNNISAIVNALFGTIDSLDLDELDNTTCDDAVNIEEALSPNTFDEYNILVNILYDIISLTGHDTKDPVWTNIINRLCLPDNSHLLAMMFEKLELINIRSVDDFYSVVSQKDASNLDYIKITKYLDSYRFLKEEMLFIDNDNPYKPDTVDSNFTLSDFLYTTLTFSGAYLEMFAHNYAVSTYKSLKTDFSKSLFKILVGVTNEYDLISPQDESGYLKDYLNYVLHSQDNCRDDYEVFSNFELAFLLKILCNVSTDRIGRDYILPTLNFKTFYLFKTLTSEDSIKFFNSYRSLLNIAINNSKELDPNVAYLLTTHIFPGTLNEFTTAIKHLSDIDKKDDFDYKLFY